MLTWVPFDTIFIKFILIFLLLFPNFYLPLLPTTYRSAPACAIRSCFYYFPIALTHRSIQQDDGQYQTVIHGLVENNLLVICDLDMRFRQDKKK